MKVTKKGVIHHGAIKYGGFSGGPLLESKTEEIVGIHHGWDMRARAGYATFIGNIKEMIKIVENLKM